MEKLFKLRDEMREDLINGSIFPFWQKYTIDEENGGFYGAVDVDLKIHKDSPKALVLNARLLWTFAGARSERPPAVDLCRRIPHF